MKFLNLFHPSKSYTISTSCVLILRIEHMFAMIYLVLPYSVGGQPSPQEFITCVYIDKSTCGNLYGGLYLCLQRNFLQPSSAYALHALLLVMPLALRAMIRHKNNRPVLTKLGGYFFVSVISGLTVYRQHLLILYQHPTAFMSNIYSIVIYSYKYEFAKVEFVFPFPNIFNQLLVIISQQFLKFIHFLTYLSLQISYI